MSINTPIGMSKPPKGPGGFPYPAPTPPGALPALTELAPYSAQLLAALTGATLPAPANYDKPFAVRPASVPPPPPEDKVGLANGGVSLPFSLCDLISHYHVEGYSLIDMMIGPSEEDPSVKLNNTSVAKANAVRATLLMLLPLRAPMPGEDSDAGAAFSARQKAIEQLKEAAATIIMKPDCDRTKGKLLECSSAPINNATGMFLMIFDHAGLLLHVFDLVNLRQCKVAATSLSAYEKASSENGAVMPDIIEYPEVDLVALTQDIINGYEGCNSKPDHLQKGIGIQVSLLFNFVKPGAKPGDAPLSKTSSSTLILHFLPSDVPLLGSDPAEAPTDKPSPFVYGGQNHSIVKILINNLSSMATLSTAPVINEEDAKELPGEAPYKRALEAGVPLQLPCFGPGGGNGVYGPQVGMQDIYASPHIPLMQVNSASRTNLVRRIACGVLTMLPHAHGLLRSAPSAGQVPRPAKSINSFTAQEAPADTPLTMPDNIETYLQSYCPAGLPSGFMSPLLYVALLRLIPCMTDDTVSEMRFLDLFRDPLIGNVPTNPATLSMLKPLKQVVDNIQSIFGFDKNPTALVTTAVFLQHLLISSACYASGAGQSLTEERYETFSAACQNLALQSLPFIIPLQSLAGAFRVAARLQFADVRDAAERNFRMAIAKQFEETFAERKRARQEAEEKRLAVEEGWRRHCMEQLDLCLERLQREEAASRRALIVLPERAERALYACRLRDLQRAIFVAEKRKALREEENAARAEVLREERAARAAALVRIRVSQIRRFTELRRQEHRDAHVVAARQAAALMEKTRKMVKRRALLTAVAAEVSEKVTISEARVLRGASAKNLAILVGWICQRQRELAAQRRDNLGIDDTLYSQPFID